MHVSNFRQSFSLQFHLWNSTKECFKKVFFILFSGSAAWVPGGAASLGAGIPRTERIPGSLRPARYRPWVGLLREHQTHSGKERSLSNLCIEIDWSLLVRYLYTEVGRTGRWTRRNKLISNLVCREWNGAGGIWISWQENIFVWDWHERVKCLIGFRFQKLYSLLLNTIQMLHFRSKLI